jgi:hypothetical protein
VKMIRRYLPLLCLPFLSVPFAFAQAGVDFNFGVGTAHAKSSNELIDTFGDGQLFRTPALKGPFLGFGGAVLLTQRYGFGLDYTLQPHKPDYAGLQARTSFFDVHGIYQPISTSRAALQLKGGIGLANVRFYYTQEGCSGFTGCSSQSQFLDSSNHFQLSGGVGVKVYLTDKVFVRPQLDLRYVPNFFQFGTNFVPGATVWVGYSLGDRP